MTSSDERSAVEVAAVWLRSYLDQHGGQGGAAAVLLAGVASGHAPRTVRRSATSIGVEMTRRARGTVWTLAAVGPGHEPGQVRGQAPDDVAGMAAEAEPATPPRTIRVPGRPDEYGIVREFVQVRPDVAAQYDERAWHSVDELR